MKTMLISLAMILGAGYSLEAGDALNLEPKDCCDGQFVREIAAGDFVWRNTAGSSYLYFDIPDKWSCEVGSPVYLAVRYLDEGNGQIVVQYDSVGDAYEPSETHTRSSRVGSGNFVTSYHELRVPNLSNRQNGNTDLRVSVSSDGSIPLSVANVSIQCRPFPDPTFTHVLSRPWLGPYRGPTRNDVDTATLRDKVFVGYQGWFRTPNDLADDGWAHWCRNGSLIPTNFTIDQWPEVSEYCEGDLVRAQNVLTSSGNPAYVFSSTSRGVVRRHLRWMREHNIDGLFLQRFATEGNSGAYGHSEWVLHHVREAANLEGRVWAIEYDVSALDDADALRVFREDWMWLVDEVRILEDPRYAREGGEPVVFVWGLPFPDREISRSTADEIVAFFKNDPIYGGNYVIGGFPWWWRNMPDWYEHFRMYDGALAWMPQDADGYAADRARLSSWGVDYFPHVWPGFSWAHLERLSGNEQFTPRAGGQFFWRKVYEAVSSGAQSLFIGMFDEYDEGTAIMPMTDDPPLPAPDWGRFVTNEGNPTDWWMALAGEARAMLLRQRPLSAVLPEARELGNRSNVGEEAWIDLGAIDTGQLLRRRQVADGHTTAETAAGRDSRRNTLPGRDLYYYFDVDDEFAFRVSNGIDLTAEVHYLDRAGNVEITFEYDSTDGPYTIHPKHIRTQGSRRWRSVRFEFSDAYFGNRQNNGSDFRVRIVDDVEVHLDRIHIFKEEHRSLCERGFRRGDCNDDGAVDISDTIFTLGVLFLGQSEFSCEDACDTNDDGAVDISDAIFTLGVLFLGNEVIRPPGVNACGVDPSDDGLDCAVSENCS